jgi:hypothetical protein
MSDQLRARVFLGTAAALCIAAVLTVADARSGRAFEERKPCCFTNERYSGVCQVLPGKNDTCSSILAYLNDPTSGGKTYCGNTNIRTGWIEVDCATGKPRKAASATPTPSGMTSPRAKRSR